MTYDEFKRVTMPLAVLLGAEWDAPTWKLYHRAVESVPLPLYVAAVAQAAETRTSKMPTAGAIRELAEGQRQAFLTAHPYDGCIDCEHSKGWREITDRRGDKRMERCPCFTRHQQRLEQMGVTPARVALALPEPERMIEP